jgi:hypothetical protein
MKNVSAKLLKAIEQVGGKVEKTGYNSFSKYHYITESDVNNAVLPALLKQGLLHTASVESVSEERSGPENKNRFATVHIVHTITDVESGEQIVLKSAGVAADTLDKSIYKALTGACKYFWLKTFLISGDDSDPEHDGVTVKTTEQTSKSSFSPIKTKTEVKVVPTEVAKVEQPAVQAETPVEQPKPSFKRTFNVNKG